PARARQPAEPVQPALVRRRLRDRPARRPARRRLEPGLRSRDRAPGGGAPGGAPAGAAAGGPAQPRHPRGNEGRRGAPRRQRRGRRRAGPAAAHPDAHGARLEGHEDGGLPHLGPPRPAQPDTSFSPTTPHTIMAMQARRAGLTLSANSTMPAMATPTAPMPVQMA